MTGWKNAELNSQLLLLPLIIQTHAIADEGERKPSYLATNSPTDTEAAHRAGKSSAFSYGRDNAPAAPSVTSAPSDVYAGLQLRSLPERLRQQPGESPALYGVEQRKWPWLPPGWPAAPQPSTSTSCTYMAWPKNEITTVFSHGILRPLSSKEIT